MSPSFQSWLKWAADKFKDNLAEARANTDVPSMGTPYVADPVSGEVAWACRHPETVTNMLPDGGSLVKCLRCAKQWSGQVIDGIDPVVADLASEMSVRMAETMRTLIEATAGTVMTPLPTQPGTMSASFSYSDFVNAADLHYSPAQRANLRSQTPFIEGDINQPQQDPELVRQNQKMNAAQMILRKKMMDEAARSAAAAFDMDEQNNTNPVKLDVDRRLKVVS